MKMTYYSFQNKFITKDQETLTSTPHFLLFLNKSSLDVKLHAVHSVPATGGTIGGSPV